MLRYFIFRHYWLIALVAAVVAISVSLMYGGANRLGWLGSSLVSVLAFCHFVQQEKLSVASLFKDAFSSFNSRYDKMNSQLLDIKEQTAPLSQAQRKLVADYFNLCAEEYVFYRQGYIPENVWSSWCRGMMFYLSNETFQSAWLEEKETDSYYGLTRQLIQASAESH